MPPDPELLLLRQRMDNHENDCLRERASRTERWNEFKSEVGKKFDSVEKVCANLDTKIDKFDAKLWAIVVMVAMGVGVSILVELIR